MSKIIENIQLTCHFPVYFILKTKCILTAVYLYFLMNKTQASNNGCYTRPFKTFHYPVITNVNFTIKAAQIQTI